MNDDRDDETGSARNGEVLPPEPKVMGARVAPFGVGAFTIARNWSERKQIESHNRLNSARNDLLRLQLEQGELLIAREKTHERLNNVGSLREIERLTIEGEVAKRRLDAELTTLRTSIEIENLYADLAEAKQRRQRIENPGQPAPPPPKMSEAERTAKAMAEINEVDGVMRAQRAAFIAGRGGEANLSPEDRLVVEKLEILHAQRIEAMYQELFG